jgi:hypothetical protein
MGWLAIKAKLLKEKGFVYVVDKYVHESGYKISCDEINKIEDSEFEKRLNVIVKELCILNSYKWCKFDRCDRILGGK